ncbi:MAG TPA: cyclic nucleotide-binding and patatin-like phospholipase domain-containing protein, partial [Acidimicrobiales bacterium]|nr:cyclic nucleotide-binding and patatin-like phospholipase domain-containing protein [Acidimicrobiales bacterium]
MKEIGRPARAREAVAAMDLVAGLSSDELDELLADVEWVEVPGGEALFYEGDVSDSFYVLVRGRVRVLMKDDSGETVIIRELARGDAIGELGLLTSAPRSATVVAVRDTELARFSKSAFERAVERTPRIALPIARVIAARMNDRRTGRAESGIGTVAFLPGGPDVDVDAFVSALVAQLPSGTDATVLRIGSVADTSEAALADAIDTAEQPGGLVLLVGTHDAGAWEVACARQSDRLVIVADARTTPSVQPVRSVLQKLDRGDVTPSEELVLIHPPRAMQPSGTNRWLDLRAFVAHHHVRLGDSGDLARVGRHLAGRTVHLALGGGGARALSQIGAVRALQEAGIPIDRIAGSSMGGVMGLQLAFGWTTEEMQERNRKEWGAAAIQRRFTVPMVSLLSVRTARPMFDRMFGASGIEDAWLPCFVTTVDLTTCRMVPQHRGSAAVWARATASPPGIWPPVVDRDGHLVVDGGVLDNLPVDALRVRSAGPVIAVNVSSREALSVDASLGEVTSPFDFVRRAARPGHQSAFPSIVRILYRTAIVASIAEGERAAARADLLIAPPLDPFALTDYRQVD